MNAARERPLHISQENWNSVDVPEATEEEWSRAVPFKDAHPDAFAAWEKNKGGRCTAENGKVRIGFRLAADVVKGVRAAGPGYSMRVERVLRDALARGEF